MKLNELRKLNESVRGHGELDEDGYFVNSQDIVHWLAANGVISAQDYRMYHDTNSVEFHAGTEVTLRNIEGWDKFEALPFKISGIGKRLSLEMPSLTTLRGISSILHGTLGLKHCHALADKYDSYPKRVKVLGLPNNTTSLVGISANLTMVDPPASSFDQQLYIPMRGIKKGGLELLNIHGLTKLTDIDGYNPKFDKRLKMFDIIQRYLGEPDQIFECQQELIENGFEAYAEL